MKSTKAILTALIILSPLLRRGAGGEAFGQGTWTQKSSLPALGRLSAVSFIINDRAYLGTGTDNINTYFYDFWEYNPSIDSWTQKANFAGKTYYGAPPPLDTMGRRSASGFSIGAKGYICSGVGMTATSGGDTMFSDLWEYDSGANIWMQKTSVPFIGRMNSVSFSINGKGYIGTGVTGGFSGVPLDDLWEYDPIGDTWTQKASLPGSARSEAVGFSMLGKGYIGTGRNSTSLLNDFWEYNPSTNVWIQKANLGNMTTARAGAAGFAIDSTGRGYIGTGWNGSVYTWTFFKYDLLADTWTQIIAFPGGVRAYARGFSIFLNGYFSCGTGSLPYNDLWEYTPSSVGIEENNFTSAISIYPNPSKGLLFIDRIEKGNIEIYNIAGQKISNQKITSEKTQVDLSAQPSGIYFVRVSTEDKVYSQKIVKD